MSLLSSVTSLTKMEKE